MEMGDGGKKRGLLYFRGGSEGRVRVACRLLYREKGGGYCIFCDIFGWNFLMFF